MDRTRDVTGVEEIILRMERQVLRESPRRYSVGKAEGDAVTIAHRSERVGRPARTLNAEPSPS
jgi:hypothetical protein